MNYPLSSIIINNYNYAEYLGKAIDSALNQSYPNIEVIVVDDGSTDASSEVIKKYGDRITAQIKENGGQASAINAGYKLSSGEILIFLDADDELLPDAVREVHKIFLAHPGVVKAQFRLQVIDGDGNNFGGFLPPKRWEQPHGDIKDVLIRDRTYVHPPTSGNAFRRSVVEELMPIPEQIYSRAPLSYLVYLVGLYGDIESIDVALGKYRMHGSNVSETNLAFNPVKSRAYLEIGAFSRKEQARIFKRKYGILIDDIAPGDLTHIKNSLILKKLSPEHYPYNHGLLELSLRGIRAATISPYIRLVERPIWILWFAGMLISTKSFSRRLIEQISIPNKRFQIFKLILGGGGRKYER